MWNLGNHRSSRGLPGGAEGIRTSDLRSAGTRASQRRRFRFCRATVEGAPLDPALDRRCFTCPAQRQRLEGLAVSTRSDASAASPYLTNAVQDTIYPAVLLDGDGNRRSAPWATGWLDLGAEPTVSVPSSPLAVCRSIPLTPAPPEQVAAVDGFTFFNQFATAMRDNPPYSADDRALRRLPLLGSRWARRSILQKPSPRSCNRQSPFPVQS
jgi:hypothetical protein